MFRVQTSSLSMFWEYSASSTNLASDWLRTESSPVDVLSFNKKEKEKWMTVSLDTSLALEESFFICYLGGAALSLASE